MRSLRKQVYALAKPDGLEMEDQAVKWGNASTHVQCVNKMSRKGAIGPNWQDYMEYIVRITRVPALTSPKYQTLVKLICESGAS